MIDARYDENTAKLTKFEVKNYLGIKTVAILQWERGKSGGSLHVELTAEQCAALGLILQEQAKVLMLERPSGSQ